MKLNADLFIHPSDRAALAALKAIPGFSQVMKAFMSVWNEKRYKIENMSTNLKLSEGQMKKYYDMLPPICEKLGIDVPELYVKLDVNPNAYTSGDTKPFIVLTSGLFETLPDELIPVVIAHECGHIACHHVLYSTMGSMLINGFGTALLSFVGGLGNIAIQPIVMAFYYWMRCSELSADRAAMLCTGSSEKIVEMCMRFAGYDKDIAADGNVDLFIEQAVEYKKLMDDSAINKTMEFYMFSRIDHPLNAVRAYEAREWEASNRFRTIIDYMREPLESKLPVKLSPRKLIGRNYDEVLQELSSLGIENVVIEREMEVSKKAKPETIVKVNINDQEDCPDDYYQRDSDIELIFYRPKTDEEISLEHPNEIKMTKSSKEYLGKDYKEVQKELAELGYGNIQVKEMAKSKIDIFSKPNQVAKILIGESTNFDEGSWHDPQVTITIYYYVLV